MRGIPRRLAKMIGRNTRRFGDRLQITLRRRSTLRHKITGEAIVALTLAAAAAEGATSVDLTAALLVGELVKGAQVTLAGTVYTTSAAVRATEPGVLAGVTLTSPLLAAAAQGAAALVTQSYSEQRYSALRVENIEESLGGWVDGASKAYRLTADRSERAPERGDLVADGTEAREAVKAVAAIDPAGGGALGWLIQVGVGT